MKTEYKGWQSAGGNSHQQLKGDHGNKTGLDNGLKAAGEINTVAIELNVSINGEDRTGRVKKELFIKQVYSFDAMKSIKGI
jgi:hypothetical protein